METLSSIVTCLDELASMLGKSGMVAQANWINERRSVIASGDHDSSMVALRELKRIVAGMGSLTDMHFQVSPNPDLSVTEYNQKFRAKVLEFDTKLRKALSEGD